MKPLGNLARQSLKFTAAVALDVVSIGPRMWFRAAQRAYCSARKGKFTKAVFAYAREARPAAGVGLAMGLITTFAGNIVGATTPAEASVATGMAIVLTNYGMALHARYFREDKLGPVPCRKDLGWFEFYRRLNSLRNGLRPQ